MKLERQIVFGLMKRGRVLFIQRGTEEIQEDQGQKPEECYHSGLARGFGVHKRATG